MPKLPVMPEWPPRVALAPAEAHGPVPHDADDASDARR